jgi:putative PIN family toxin of toxin-antitoxin system
MRVVLDTNVLLSGLAYPHSGPGRIVAAWRAGSLEVVLSSFVLDELARVLHRLNHRLKLSPLERKDLIDSLALQADVIEPGEGALQAARTSGLAQRDGADVAILALLIDCGAECLISGDKDLLALSDRFPILAPAPFCLRHGL